MAYWPLILGWAHSFLRMSFHGVIEGKIYSGNIRKSDLEPLGKTLSHFSRQFHTIHLFVCGATLVFIAYHSEYAVACLSNNRN